MATKKKNAQKIIEKYLTDKYGEVQPQWQFTINTIVENLQMIEDCRTEIKRVGLYNDRTGRKNPLIATIKDCQAVLLKCYQQLGLTPWSESKIKGDNENGDAELLQQIMG